jgi:hypothetical protein
VDGGNGMTGSRSSATAVSASPVPKELTSSSYTFWSSDFHISPTQDMREMFKDLCDSDGICQNLAEHSFSGHCAKTFGGRKNTCAKGRIMGPVMKQNGFDFCPKPNQLRRAFFKDMSKPSSPLHKVDAFVCNHPPAFCELYMPFNKSMLVWVTVNLEFSRENPTRFAEVVENIRRIASVPNNVVAANSRYDQEYVRYFTGVDPVYLPSYCGYVKAKYKTTTKKMVLFGRNHRNPHQYAEIKQQATQHGFTKFTFERIEKAYPNEFQYTDLATHPAVVLIPYTKSVMSFFELYRMNIPIWVPDVSLLSSWEQKERILKERVYWSKTPLPVNPKVSFNPNDLKNIKAIEHWVALSDYYTFPHVQTFSSYEVDRKG